MAGEFNWAVHAATVAAWKRDAVAQAPAPLASADMPIINFLYHAVWMAVWLVGIVNPFGLEAHSSVYGLRIMVAKVVAGLMTMDRVGNPDREGPAADCMTYMLKRTIVTLSADGIHSVAPSNYRGFFGKDDNGPPFAIYNCQFANALALVPAANRNHYGAVYIHDIQALQLLVTDHRAPGVSEKQKDKNEDKNKVKTGENEDEDEGEGCIAVYRLRALLRLHRGENLTVCFIKFGLYLLRLGPLTKGSSRTKTLELTELGKWLFEIGEWERCYAWKFGYSTKRANGVKSMLKRSGDKFALHQLEHALRNDFSYAKLRMGYHAEGHDPEVLAAHVGLEDDGVGDEDVEDSDDYEYVDSDTSEDEEAFPVIVDMVEEESAQERIEPFPGDRAIFSEKFGFVRSFDSDDILFNIVQDFVAKEERRRRVTAAAKRKRAKLIEKRYKKRATKVKKRVKVAERAEKDRLRAQRNRDRKKLEKVGARLKKSS
ncbi:hypothetical protein JG688_00006038, partial [Phytophthora aleatoria]